MTMFFAQDVATIWYSRPTYGVITLCFDAMKDISFGGKGGTRKFNVLDNEMKEDR